MTTTFRHSLPLFTTLVLTCSVVSAPVSGADHREAPLIWSVSPGQTFRVCVNGRARTAAGLNDVPTELVQLNLRGHLGSTFGTFLATEIAVPAGSFRCVDFPHSLLVEALRGAGGEPEQTGAVTYQYDLVGNITSDRSAKTKSFGAAMNFNSLAGKVELYATIGLRTPIIELSPDRAAARH